MSLVYDFLELVSISSSIMPLFLFFLIRNTKGVQNNLFLLILCLFTLEFVVEFACLILSRNGIYTNPIIHIYSILYILLIFNIYRKLIESDTIIKIALVSVLIFLPISVIEFVKNLYLPNTISYTFLSLLTIFLSTAFFSQMLNDRSIKSFMKYSLFWINSGFLLFFGTTVCLSLFEYYINFENPDLVYYLWPVQLISNIVFYILIAKGIWLMKRI
tara:strand:+ start:21206 stop:21853 length:648 start_codon:yes stop_codon:yes gene_type:complete